MLASSAPFLLEGDRIISLLTGPDLLRLWVRTCALMNRTCVNRMMHEAVSRDVVWMKVFKQDSKEDIDMVIQNEWLAKKWDLLRTAVTAGENSKESV